MKFKSTLLASIAAGTLLTASAAVAGNNLQITNNTSLPKIYVACGSAGLGVPITKDQTLQLAWYAVGAFTKGTNECDFYADAAKTQLMAKATNIITTASQGKIGEVDIIGNYLGNGQKTLSYPNLQDNIHVTITDAQ